MLQLTLQNAGLGYSPHAGETHLLNKHMNVTFTAGLAKPCDNGISVTGQKLASYDPLCWRVTSAARLCLAGVAPTVSISTQEE